MLKIPFQIIRVAASVVVLSTSGSLLHAAEPSADDAVSTDTVTTTPRRLVAPLGVKIEQDVAFLETSRTEKLDVYLPSQREESTLSPAVVIIHGGGWVGGSKSGKREYVTGVYLVQHGYVCVSVEYMKEAGKRWPTNLFDCKNAVRWLRKNAQRLQVDPQRIGVIGGSAGGHLALMVAYTSDVPALQPSSPYPGIPDNVSACVDMYGIANVVTRQWTDSKGVPSGKLRSGTALFPESREQALDKWQLASPVTHVTPQSPPTLILHGTADTTVDRDQSHELDQVLTKNGVAHKLVEIPSAGHAFALDDSKLPRDLRPEVLAFFDEHLSGTVTRRQ